MLTVSGGPPAARPDQVSRWLRRLLYAAAWAQAHGSDVSRILARDNSGPGISWTSPISRLTLGFSLFGGGYGLTHGGWGGGACGTYGYGGLGLGTRLLIMPL